MTINQLANHFGVIIPEIVEDMVHIKETAKAKNKKFIINPAVCNHCGFSFKDRNKLKKPSKCPKCKSEDISEPVFAVQ